MEENTPPLWEIKEATRDAGLVGEETNVLTGYLGTINGKLVLFFGPASSGKDATIDAFTYVIDDPALVEDEESTLIYNWSGSSSAKAPFYKHEKLNRIPVHIIPDRVTMDPDMEGFVKAFGEGESATHEKVDITLSDLDGPGGQLVDMKIECPRATFMSIADNNTKIDLEVDLAEANSRAFKLTPDSSEEQTRRINIRQVEMRDGSYERRVDDSRLREIRQHYRDLQPEISKFTESPAGEIWNLVMAGIQEQEPIPPKFVHARRDIPRLMDFIDAVALYHIKDRMVLTDEYPQKLLVTPADAWYGFRIFGEELVMSSLNLRPLDRKILEFLRARPNEKYSVMELQGKMNEMFGETRSRAEIRTAVENMIAKNYLSYNDGQPVKYSVSPFGSNIDVASQAAVDWSLVVERAKEKARANLSEEHAEEYIRRFCQGDGLIVVDPVAKEYTEINILEDTSFGEALEEAQEEMDETWADTPMWGSADGENAVTEADVVTDGGEGEGKMF